jgi:hypothetical protein
MCRPAAVVELSAGLGAALHVGCQVTSAVHGAARCAWLLREVVQTPSALSITLSILRYSTC